MCTWCVYVCMYVCIFIYMCACMYVYTYYTIYDNEAILCSVTTIISTLQA